MAKRPSAAVIVGSGNDETISNTTAGNDAAIAGNDIGADNSNGSEPSSFHGLPVESFGAGGSGGDNGSGTTTDGNAGEPERKRRGRKPGSVNTGTKKKGAPDLAGVTLILASVHGLAAIMLDTPELALADSEAKVLSTSICEVMKHYPTEASEKALAWTNLVIVAGGIYGTRIMAIRARKNKPTQLRAA